VSPLPNLRPAQTKASAAALKATESSKVTSRSPRTNAPTAASTRPVRKSKGSPAQLNKTPQQAKLPQKDHSRNSVERRTTEYAGITKGIAKGTAKGRANGKGKAVPSRRLAFITYTKQMDAKFRADTPQSARDHREFVWQYIDDMEDKDMSAVVQDVMRRSFPETVSASKGRGKPYRKIIISGDLQWPMVLGAVKTMAVPDFLKEDL
jgi:hypothetical protein